MSDYIDRIVDYKETWINTYPRQAPSVLFFLVGSAANTAIKVGASALALLPYNSNSKLNSWAHEGFDRNYSIGNIFPSLLFLTIRLFNPYSEGFYNPKLENEISSEKSIFTILPILAKQEVFEGNLTSVAHKIFEKAILAADKTQDITGGFLDPAASGLFLAGTVVVILAKGLELAAGFAFGSAALVTFGTIPAINRLAMSYLSSLNVVDEVLAGILAFTNPWREHGHIESLWYPNRNNIFEVLGL